MENISLNTLPWQGHLVWEDVPAVNSLKYCRAILATQWECE